MQRVALAGLVVFGLAGVAHADSPGGWDQFTATVRAQAAKSAQVQPVQQQVQQAQAKPVYQVQKRAAD